MTESARHTSADIRRFSSSELSAIFSKPSIYAISTLIITGLSSATTLLAPALLTASQFASFVLLASFFQLASRLDFGLSELADRYGHNPHNRQETSEHLIHARWMIASIILPLIGLSIYIFSKSNTLLPPLDLTLALTGGLLAMIAVGPVTVARAKNNIKDFAVLALTLQLGMTLPRLLGLALGGTTGCYLALTLWYVIFAARTWHDLDFKAYPWRALVSPLQQAFPLFLSALLWLCIQFLPRWLSAAISSQDDFSHLAFAFNIVALATGSLTTIGQAFYPRYLILRREGKGAQLPDTLRKDLFKTIFVAFLALAVILPLIPFGIIHLYPRYTPAIRETLIMVISLMPLIPVLWFVPLIVAIAAKPLRTMSLLTLPAGFALALLIFVLYYFAGREGQAFAILVFSFLLFLVFTSLLKEHALLRSRPAFWLIPLMVVLALSLVGEAQWIMVQSQ